MGGEQYYISILISILNLKTMVNFRILKNDSE